MADIRAGTISSEAIMSELQEMPSVAPEATEVPGVEEGSEAENPLPLLTVARERHAALVELLEHAVGTGDAEFVHDVRVATRRLGEVARMAASVRGVLDKPSAKAVQASLKAVRQSMGALRDADVVTDHLLKWRMPGPVKQVARALAEQHAAERAGLAKAADAQLQSASFSGTMVILARVLEQPPEASEKIEQEMQGALQDLIKKRRKQVRKAFGKAASKQTAESLHAARIVVKKLRYLVELSQSFVRGAGKEVKVLKQFQELLGDHHDVHVIEEQLERQIRKTVPAPRNLGAACRKWHREMERGQAKRAAEFLMKSYAWINQ